MLDIRYLANTDLNFDLRADIWYLPNTELNFDLRADIRYLANTALNLDVITDIRYLANTERNFDLSARIAKTCLYNFDPLKTHFYIVKLGFTGVYIIFLISAQNIDCGYSLEPPQ